MINSYGKSSEKLAKNLKEHIFDQEDAVELIVKTLVKSSVLNKGGAPRAFFTFIGEANCGKHYLGQLLAKYDSNIENIKSFHMDQYSGSYPLGGEQFSNSSIEDEIVEFVKKNPKSVLMFEDIEKADLQIQLDLYTLFSERSAADFSQVIVILTTTRLGSILQRQDFKEIFKSDPLQAHTFLMERLNLEKMLINGVKEEAFDKKLLSLMNEHVVIPFNKLSLSALIKIGARTLSEMTQEFIKESRVDVEYFNFDKVASLLTLSLAPYLNARHIIKKVPQVMFNHVYEALKSEKNIEKLNFDVSKEAKEFVKEVLKNQNLFIKKISKQHFRVSLEWDTKIKKNELTFLIKKASYVEEALSTSYEDSLYVSDIAFDDVAGQQSVKKELQEIIALLKEPQRLKNFGMNPPKGMLLYGPSGMGKKLLARAFAYEVDMPYTVISGSDLFNESQIHKAYSQAYSAAPAIVIFEDIQTQGLINGMISRMNMSPLLDELDALTQSFESPIFTILTLDELENIPESITQAGRIDIRIEVPKLDIEARRFFINEVLKKPHEESIDVEKVVRYISGMSGNELKRISQEVAISAARKGLKEITQEILLEQINIIKYGTKLEKKQIRDIELSLSKTAYHEAAHAVLSYFLLPNIKIEQVTVAPRSDALGFVSYNHEDYIDATSKDDIFNDICVLMAGRISTIEKFGESGMETGAINDLEIASMQAYAAIALFGMDEELGFINVSGIEMGYDKKVLTKKIDERLLIWIEKAKEKSTQEVKKHWKAIEAVAKELLKKEVIDGEELKEIIKAN